MTRVVRIHEPGGPDALVSEEIDVGDPGRDEARVRHRVIGINYIDTYHRSGLYRLPALPAVLGSEASGIVEAVGPGVTEVAVGDRVAYAGGPPGAYAEARVLKADRLVKLPDDISDETAAASMLKGMTAEYLVRRTVAVEPGQTVLVHAAAGGVGLILCQWLAHIGATVIGTVGSEEKAELARSNGATHAILYRDEDFVARVHEITGGRGVPIVYDSVGKTTVPGSLRCLDYRGLLVVYGNASGRPDPVDLAVLSERSLYVSRPVLFHYTALRSDLLACANALFDVLRSGAVKVHIAHRYPLAEAATAHRELEARRTSGSLLLVP
jgi:NADPH2:quinone reductase